MQKTEKIDFAKLLGFETVSDRLSGTFDFRDQTFGDKLGAKVGLEPPNGVALFEDDTVAAKLGSEFD
jgi:hypothetical protein